MRRRPGEVYSDVIVRLAAGTRLAAIKSRRDFVRRWAKAPAPDLGLHSMPHEKNPVGPWAPTGFELTGRGGGKSSHVGSGERYFGWRTYATRERRNEFGSAKTQHARAEREKLYGLYRDTCRDCMAKLSGGHFRLDGG
jgi:hypothetical protein